MPALPSPAEVATFAGWGGDASTETRAAAHIAVVAAAAKAYTRGIGVNGEDWDAGLCAVIMLATARLLNNPDGDQQLTRTQGPFTESRTATPFTSWSLVELGILNDLRRRTNRPVG